jgi:hypothetical protein
MTNSSFYNRAHWWTSVIVTLTMTIFGGVMRIIERSFNSAAYDNVQTFFKTSQPDYFPLLHLGITFIVVLAIVTLYRLVLTHLPMNWIIRGLLVGLFLFLIADLPDAFTSYYMTVLSGSAVWGMTISAFANKLINGLILTYTYKRLSPDIA